MSIANALSWSRLFSTPVVMFLLWADGWKPAYVLAAVLFALAEVTDVLDGYFARRQGTVSNLGIFLDLTADKIFTAGVLVMMAEKQILSAWLIAIILSREFLITGIRTYAAAEGVVIPAGKWGKRKVILTAISLTWLMFWADSVRPNGLLYEATQSLKIGDVKVLELFFGLAWPLTYLMVILTVYSGFIYMRDAAYLFTDPPKKKDDVAVGKAPPNSASVKVPSSKRN